MQTIPLRCASLAPRSFLAGDNQLDVSALPHSSGVVPGGELFHHLDLAGAFYDSTATFYAANVLLDGAGVPALQGHRVQIETSSRRTCSRTRR